MASELRLIGTALAESPLMKSPKTPTAKDTQTCTIGLDLGDAQHTYCVLDAEANILSRGKVRNDREPLALWLSQWPGAKIVMEAGTHMDLTPDGGRRPQGDPRQCPQDTGDLADQSQRRRTRRRDSRVQIEA